MTRCVTFKNCYIGFLSEIHEKNIAHAATKLTISDLNSKKCAVSSHVSSTLRHWIPPSATDIVAHAHTQTFSERSVQ